MTTQQRSALRKANDIRKRQSDLKRALKADDVALEDALANEAAQNMKVFDLICYLPAYGPSRAKYPSRAEKLADDLLRKCGASRKTLVRELGPRRTPILVEEAARRMRWRRAA